MLYEVITSRTDADLLGGGKPSGQSTQTKTDKPSPIAWHAAKIEKGKAAQMGLFESKDKAGKAHSKRPTPLSGPRAKK